MALVAYIYMVVVIPSAYHSGRKIPEFGLTRLEVTLATVALPKRGCRRSRESASVGAAKLGVDDRQVELACILVSGRVEFVCKMTNSNWKPLTPKSIGNLPNY